MNTSTELSSEQYISLKKYSKLKELSCVFEVSVETIITGIWGLLIQRYNNSLENTVKVVNHSKDIICKMQISHIKNQKIKEYFEMIQNNIYGLDIENDINEINSTIHLYMGNNKDQENKFRSYLKKNKCSDINLIVSIGNPTKIKVLHNTHVEEELEQRVIKHFIHVIELMVSTPYIRVNEIEILTLDEKRAIFDNNNTEYLIPHSKIHELFEDQVLKTPDKVAVSYEGKTITYLELNMKANQLARAIHKTGLKEGEVVALTLKRSSEMLIALLGTLKAGCICLPIDTNNPNERIDFILKDSKAKMIITEDYKNNTFKGEYLIFGKSSFNEYKTSNLETKYLNDLAYIIYTSGSTGEPKGVLLKHSGVVNHAFAKIFDLEIDKEDIISHNLNFTFVASIWQYLSPLFTGAQIIIFPDEVIKNPALLLDQIDYYKITILEIVPSVLKTYIHTIECGSPMFQFNTLRHILLTGEKVSSQLVNDFYNHYKIQLTNAYGQSECSDDTLHYRIPYDIKTKVVPIGKPVINTKVYVIDVFNNLQVCGFPGELVIAGEGVSPGYTNKQLNTNFVEHLIPGQSKVFRTGDTVRIKTDGNIEYLGRNDFQVKIRGHRVELEEIESMIIEIPGIQDVAVLSKLNDTFTENQLIAFIVYKEGARISDFYHVLETRLPSFMIPSHIIELDKLPLNDNGKVDRKKLLKIKDVSQLDSLQDYSSKHEYIAPKNEIEKELVNIWKKVIGRKVISTNEKFIELGGNSLNAMVLSTMISTKFNVDIPSTMIFQRPTIQQIAECINNGKKVTTINPVKPMDFYPTSSEQKRMYIVSQLNSGLTAYNIPLILQIDGVLNINKLENAFQSLIQRHETLRTSFELINNELYQIISDEVLFRLEKTSTTNQQLESIVNNFIQPFDLGKAPLFRGKLVQINNNRHVLMIDIHHIISDGLSMNIILKDLATFYREETINSLSVQYRDYSSWQHKYKFSEVVQSQEQYWINLFTNYEPIQIPTDYVRPAIQQFEGNQLSFEVDSEILNMLKEISKNNDVTLYTLLLAAFNVLLYRYTGQEDIVVGSLVAGRNHGNLMDVIGMFVNTLALRNWPKGDKTFQEFLLEVKENVLKAHENQDYPFEVLVEKLKFHTDISRNPLFDTLFIFQNDVMEDVNLYDLKLTIYPQKSKVSKFDLTLVAEEQNNKLIFNIEYSIHLFKQETIKRFFNHYKNILKEIIKQQDIKIKNIEILSTIEQNQLIEKFNDTATIYPKEKTINEIFEEQVLINPEKVAVVFEDKQLTYSQLNEKANKLAHEIIRTGILKNQVIGIMTEKSIELVIGMLAVLKVGGIYLPIDPEVPQKRILFMLEDSNSQLLLTQQKFFNKVDFNNVLDIEIVK
ncbi:amino acid adenylation domain-containing protein [Fictibacillus nanhaiensis]|uniref:amino acid adenylation domain-containing protein n=1 Tax=Fictibacillus nanhaiensis TaxID=742169 RepID=UPI003C1F3C08